MYRAVYRCIFVAHVPYYSMPNVPLKRSPAEPGALHPKLAQLGNALELVRQSVPLPMEAEYALAALQANLSARAVYLDGTSALLLSRVLRGLAMAATPTPTST
jgi:hypothetical protein